MLLNFSKLTKINALTRLPIHNKVTSTPNINKLVCSKQHQNRRLSTITIKKPEIKYAFTLGFWMNQLLHREYSNPLPPSNNLDEVLIDGNTYEIVCSETLDALCEYFDELVESTPDLKDADVAYGVLLV